MILVWYSLHSKSSVVANIGICRCHANETGRNCIVKVYDERETEREREYDIAL